MKKLLSVLALSLLLAGCSSNSGANRLEQIMSNKQIKMVTSPDYAPYEFVDATKSGQDQYVGADIELGRYIAEKLGVELVIEAVDFNTVLGNMTLGKSDIAISGLGVTADRSEAMSFSIAYNLTESTCHGVVIRKEDESVFTDFASLSGKKVGAQNASLQHQYATAQITGATIETIAGLNDGILMLKSGKISALASSCDTAKQFIKTNPELILADYKFEYGIEGEGTSIAVPKGEQELLDKVNEILKEVQELGLYEKWVEEGVALADALGIE